MISPTDNLRGCFGIVENARGGERSFRLSSYFLPPKGRCQARPGLRPAASKQSGAKSIKRSRSFA